MYRYRLTLIGEVQLTRDDGKKLTPTGKKARGLLSIVAVSPHGSRGRRWLQGLLWSDRGENEAAASLRQCLSEIRRTLGEDHEILLARQQSIGLDLSRVDVDVRDIDKFVAQSDLNEHELPEFLESLEIVDPEFTNWIRDQRHYWDGKLRSTLRSRADEAASLPAGNIEGAASQGGRSLSAPVKYQPVVSVKPLETMDPSEDAVVSETLTYELIEQLSRTRWLLTTAQSSCFSDRVRNLPVDKFGATLGSDYVVAGKLYREEQRYVLRLELIEASSSLVVWNNVFYLLSDKIEQEIASVAKQIAGNISGRISHSEQIRANSGAGRSDEIRNLIWRGRWHLNRLKAEDADKAEMCFRRILALDPYHVEAHVQIAWCKLWNVWARRGPEEEIIEGRELGRLAMSLDPTDARAYWIVGTAEAWLRHTEVARASINEAIRLCPSMALAHAQLGSCFILSGQPERALEPLSTAIRLSPEDQHIFYFHGEQAMALWLLDRPEEALRASDQSLLRRSSYWYAHLVKVLSYKAMRNESRAQAARNSLFQARPQLTEADIEWLPFSDAQINQTIIERAGLFT